MNRLFRARRHSLFNGCHYIGVAITPDCTLQRLGQLYDHTFCPSMISSGAFMRNWAMCKKVLAKSHFFLKHGWIHFLGFLLIPRYNHDKITGEFKQWCRKIGILHFPCGGYFFILFSGVFSHHYAIAYLLYHKTFLWYTQLRIRNCTNFCTIMLRWTSSWL